MEDLVPIMVVSQGLPVCSNLHWTTVVDYSLIFSEETSPFSGFIWADYIENDKWSNAQQNH